MREGRIDAVHVTISYHENFRETVLNFEQWNRWFEQYPDLIMKGQWAEDVDRARNRTHGNLFRFSKPKPDRRRYRTGRNRAHARRAFHAVDI